MSYFKSMNLTYNFLAKLGEELFFLKPKFSFDVSFWRMFFFSNLYTFFFSEIDLCEDQLLLGPQL